MWDYDKLFAKGNVIGVLNYCENKFEVGIIDDNNLYEWRDYYANDELSYKDEALNIDAKIQYIIRLDEHGDVVEKLFDRERDMKPEPEPMPELKTGMFVRVNRYDGSHIGFVDAENNHVIYQEGGYDFIDDDDINGRGIASKIVEVYSKDSCAFDFCTEDDLIWRKLESN